jgi:hypothetical protein
LQVIFEAVVGKGIGAGQSAIAIDDFFITNTEYVEDE